MYKLDGNLYLLKNIKLDNGYSHTFTFNSKEEQHGYFYNHVYSSIEGISTIRNGVVNVNKTFADLDGVNYCFYRNNQLQRWFYCFVVEKNYIGENVTQLVLEVDVMQTYGFDYEVGSSFITREHMDRWESQGVPIWNLTEEPLPFGNEYWEIGSTMLNTGTGALLVATTEPLSGWSVEGGSYLMGGVPTGLHYYVIPTAVHEETTLLNKFIKAKQPIIASAKLLEIPYEQLISNTQSIILSDDYEILIDIEGKQNSLFVKKVLRFLGGNNPINMERTHNGLCGTTLPALGVGIRRTPAHESKLLQYPYRYNCLIGSSGENVVLKNEFLKDFKNIQVKCYFSIIDDLRYDYFVQGYKDMNSLRPRINKLSIAELGNIPLLSDAYTNFKMQNSFSGSWGIPLTIASGVATSVATMNPVGLIGTVTSAISQLGKIQDVKNAPDSLVGKGSDHAYKSAVGNLRPYMNTYEILGEYKSILADFFSKYGYQCNRVKKPNLKSRYYYNFIQTNGANIYGNIDNQYISTIKNNYDRGITLWHYNGNEFNLNYEFDNVERRFI